MANTTSLTGLSKDILRKKYILEGSKILLEATNPTYFKLLVESNNSDILLENKFLDFYNKIVKGAKDSKTRKAISAYFAGIPWMKKNAPEVLSLLPKFIQKVKEDKDTSVKEVIAALLSQKEITKEATDDILNTTDPGKPGFFKSFSDKTWYPDFVKIMEFLPSAEGLKKALGIIATALLVGSGAAQQGITYANNIDAAALNASNRAIVQAYDNPTDKTLSTFTKTGVTLPGQKTPGVYDVDGNTIVIKNFGAQGKHGTGLDLPPDGDEDVKNTAKQIKKDIDNGAKNLKVKYAGVTNNTTGEDEKATDTDEDLSKARGETGAEELQDELEKLGVDTEDIEFEAIKTNPASDHTQQKAKSSNGTGVLFQVEEEIPEGGEPVPPPTIEFGEWGIIDPAGGNSETPRTGGETPRIGGGETPRTGGEDPLILFGEFSGLNRTQQWAVVLATISPELNITKFGEVKRFKDIPSFEYNDDIKYKDPKTKELALLTVNLRKSPNAFLKRLPGVTGIALHDRAKAVSISKRDSRAQLQSIAESKELFLEASVSDIFTDYEGDIKKNRIEISALIGTMFAKEGEPDVSVLDATKINKEDRDKLLKTKVKFTPQQKGKNYIFLLGRSAKDVGAIRTNKKTVQADTKRALDIIVSREKELKPFFDRISNRQEFADFIVGIIRFVEERLQQDASKLRSALFKLRGKDRIKEEEKRESMQIDAKRALEKIQRNTFLVQALKKISNIDELEQFLAGIFTYITKVNATDKRSALIVASNVLTSAANKGPRKKPQDNKDDGGPIFEIRRMQELAGIKK